MTGFTKETSMFIVTYRQSDKVAISFGNRETIPNGCENSKRIPGDIPKDFTAIDSKTKDIVYLYRYDATTNKLVKIGSNPVVVIP
jgi:hypothetical protein